MKTAQIWTLDLIAGMVLFLIVIVMYFMFSNTMLQPQDETYADIYRSLEIVSGSLMTSGNPLNWTADDVNAIGITNGNYRLNTSKLANFSTLDYSEAKLLLKTNYEYLIFFENRSDDVIPLFGQSYFGKPGITRDNIQQIERPKTLLLTKRFLIYNSEIIVMEVYLWE